MTAQTVTYDPSSAQVLTAKAKAAESSAKDLIIDSQDMAAIAGDELRQIKTLQKQVEEQRTSITKPLNEALRAVNALFKAPAEFLDRAEATVKRSILTWNAEQERIAMEARRKAEEEARKERQRLEEEARAAAEAASKALAEAQVAQAVGDTQAAAASQAEYEDQAEAAEAATLTAQVMTFTPAVQVPAKVQGIAGRVTYSAQVDDLMDLVKAVASGKAPIECLAADTKFLNAQARAFKKAGQLYPGVTAVAERGLAARAA